MISESPEVMVLVAPAHIKGFTSIIKHFHRNLPLKISQDKEIRKLQIPRGTRVRILANYMASHALSSRKELTTDLRRSVELVV